MQKHREGQLRNLQFFLYTDNEEDLNGENIATTVHVSLLYLKLENPQLLSAIITEILHRVDRSMNSSEATSKEK